MWFLKLVGRLPLPILYAKASFLSFLLYHVIRYRKKVVYSNLRNSFPAEDEATIRMYTREFYRRFTDYAVETMHVVAMDLDKLSQHCTISWDKELQPFIDREAPVLVLTSHIFNWEWTLHAFRNVSNRPYAAVYQRLTNPVFDRYMQELRTSTGGGLVEKSNVIRYLVKHRNNLPGIVMLADQSPGRETQKYWTTFLHQDTAFYLGPDIISYSTKMPVFFYQVRRIRRGKYAIHIKYLSMAPVVKGGDEIIENYVRELEKLVQEDPPAYLWSHRRWKLKKPPLH